MAEANNELIHEVRKQMQGNIAQNKFDLREVKYRPTSPEEGVASLDRRMDRREDRMDHLEKRVGLVDQPLP